MVVVEAAYRRINPQDQWYQVCIEDLAIGEVFKTKKGWQGFCLNAPKKPLGFAKTKEALGQMIVARWEAFPVKA